MRESLPEESSSYNAIGLLSLCSFHIASFNPKLVYLIKDGEWNTICLPFDLVLEGSPLEGATAKTLTNAEVTDNGEYTHVELTFGDDMVDTKKGETNWHK